MAEKKSNYIEIKGPFTLRDHNARARVSAGIKILSAKYPDAKFILREGKSKNPRRASVYSQAHQTLSTAKQGKKIKVIQTKHGIGGGGVKGREAKIAALNPFKQVEFTYSGKVATDDYKQWREFDISLSSKTKWDPLKSKGQHFQAFEGYDKANYHVKAYPGGGSTSATKKIDAVMDKISEYGQSKDARPEKVSAGIEYLKDKSDLFEVQQRTKINKEKRYNKRTGDVIHSTKESIPMLSGERLKRLDRLEKNYGLPQSQKGKVNVTGTGDKKIKAQVPIQTDPHKIYRSNVKVSDKTKDKKLDLPLSKKGEVGTGLRESGTASSYDPVGITREVDSVREFDEDAVMSHKDDAPRYPTESSERVYFDKPQGRKEGNPTVTYDEFPPKPFKIKTTKHNVVKHPAQISPSNFDPDNRKYSQFPGLNVAALREAVTGIKKQEFNPFSKISSGLSQFTTQDTEFDADTKINTKSKIDEIKSSDYDSLELGEDRSGGTHYATDTGDHLDKEQKRLDSEMQEIERKPWLKDKVRSKIGDTKKTTSSTFIPDSLQGDAVDKSTNPKSGGKDRVVSATSPDSVRDPIPGVYKPDLEKDPFANRAKKPRDPKRDAFLKAEAAKGDTTKVVTKTNKKGEKYKLLERKYPKLKTTLVDGKPITEGMPIQEQLDRESAVRKVKGSREDQGLKRYIANRNAQIKEKRASGELKLVETRPGKGEHGSMKVYSTLTAKSSATAKLSNSQKMKAAKLAKGLLPPVLSVGALALTPIVAEASLKNKGITAPTTKQRATENFATFLSSPRVFGGVNEKKGYIQKVGWGTKGVDGGRRPNKPIKGAGGPNTPYAQMKRSLSNAMKTWSSASAQANESMKLHGGWRFK